MLEVIEKLLIVQDRDRKIVRLKYELNEIAPERQQLQAKADAAQASLDAAKHQAKHLESERKKLELEAEGKKQQIEKYSLQQFQTKKNDEFRALAQEIDNCQAEIVRLEDQQLEIMEKAEVAQRQVAGALKTASEAKALVQTQTAELAVREKNLKTQLAEFEAHRDELAAPVEEGILQRYERLRKNKGENVLVGIEHGACGGCHMKLPVQITVSCKGDQEVVSCPNCGRILYYTRGMDLAVAE